MIKKIIILAAMGLTMMTAMVATSQTTSAINPWGACGQGGQGAVCGASGRDDFSKTMQKIINMILYILGVIAVIAIIFGGIRYTTANGDASQIKSAKDTIMYAVVGLVVAIMAWGIVGFVVSRF